MTEWVLLLGGSTGHGAATAKQLAKDGYGIIAFHDCIGNDDGYGVPKFLKKIRSFDSSIKLKKIEEKWISNDFKVSEKEVAQVLEN